MKAKEYAKKRKETLTLKLHNSYLYSFEELSNFLQAFHIADSIEPLSDGGFIPTMTPSIPCEEEAVEILARLFKPKIGSTIFENIQSFLPILRRFQNDNQVLITTNGCFDILHPGHLKTLQSSKKFDGVMIVLINSDASISRLKGNDRPINNWIFRSLLLSEIDIVHYVVVFDKDTPLEALQCIKPAWHIKGGSYDPVRVQVEADLLEEWGGKIHFEPMLKNYSTTGLLDQFKHGPFPI
ncbi:MAG: adenylyltransferase/cytidyltransferase family protein [bacterium]